MKVVNGDREQSRGVVLPVKNAKKAENSIFPQQEYDWDDIKNRIIPLVENVINEGFNEVTT